MDELERQVRALELKPNSVLLIRYNVPWDSVQALIDTRVLEAAGIRIIFVDDLDGFRLRQFSVWEMLKKWLHCKMNPVRIVKRG